MGLTWEEFEKKGDDEISRLFQKRAIVDSRYLGLEKLFQWMEKELGRPGVTLKTLWEEYKTGELFTYEYSQYCHHFQSWQATRDVRMHIEHKAGDKLFVDFAGEKLQITDRKTGMTQDVEVFVAVLGWSQMTYVEAVESQRIGDWVRMNENALRFYGGMPLAIVPDNLKSGVTKACRYEPEINMTYDDFAKHYGTVILPARPRKPRDKALVEGAVNIIYQRIICQDSQRSLLQPRRIERADLGTAGRAQRGGLPKEGRKPVQPFSRGGKSPAETIACGQV